DGVIGPVEAVKAYHAVLDRLGIKPHRALDDDLQRTDQAMSYAGTRTTVTVPAAANGQPCRCAAGDHAKPAASCACQSEEPAAHRNGQPAANGYPRRAD